MKRAKGVCSLAQLLARLPFILQDKKPCPDEARLKVLARVPFIHLHKF